MSTYIILFIALANIIAILLVYYSFGKNIEKQKKLINTMIIVGAIYLLILIVYDLSTIGIDKNSVSDTAKTIITITFVPVNTILFAPFLIRSVINTKDKKVSSNNLMARFIIVTIVAIIVLVLEFFTFRNFQQRINNMQKQLEAINNVQNQAQNMIDQNQIRNEAVNTVNNTTNTTNRVSNSSMINANISNKNSINNMQNEGTR